MNYRESRFFKYGGKIISILPLDFNVGKISDPRLIFYLYYDNPIGSENINSITLNQHTLHKGIDELLHAEDDLDIFYRRLAGKIFDVDFRNISMFSYDKLPEWFRNNLITREYNKKPKKLLLI